ncbi:MAG: hypothetical protein MJ204_02640 [Bacteroidales bacterium]|nr:hypothetical protein [Bacteroidales bacterium]MCQ2605425.1 hypothetical protein [Bacteroidales bacterium]
MGTIKEQLTERSEKFRLNLRDIAKSAFTGALTAGVTAIYTVIENSTVDGQMTVTTAILSVIAYLLKNLVENKNGDIK